MRRCFAWLVCASVLAVGACADAPTGPGELLSGDAEAALARAAELPTLEVLNRRARSLDAIASDPAALAALDRADRLWRDATGLDWPERARMLRADAYALALPHLSAAFGEADRRDAAADAREWIATASDLLSGHAIAEIERALADAEELLRGVERAERAGDAPAAVAGLLRAADRLRPTTPARVAERLIRDAERARADWRQAMDSVGGDRDIAFRRADRLLAGARQAFDDADFVRAIRRAYYAGQLLGER